MTTLEARGLGVAFERGEVLRDVDVQVHGGEFVAILGPNGAGKTTLLRALAGLIGPRRGRVMLDGRAVHAMPSAERSRRIAFLAPARVAVPHGYPVRDVVGLARFAHHDWWRTTGRDDRAVAEALARFELGAFAERPVGQLSDGERQRVWLAALEAQASEVLLLDEPTSHLDVAHVAATLRALRRWALAGHAVAAVFHELDAALAAADRLVVLRAGRLILDQPVTDVDLADLGAAFEVRLVPARLDGRIRALVADFGARS